MKKIEGIIIRYNDIEQIILKNFGNKEFELFDHIYNVSNDTYQLYENIGSNNDIDEKWSDFMSRMTEFLKTNNEEFIQDDGVNAEDILECLVYNKLLEPGNYLIDISW